jgi:hypothetical protein
VKRGRNRGSAGAVIVAAFGYLYGSILAMVVSYTNWASIIWAMWHSLLSWVYILYFVMRY